MKKGLKSVACLLEEVLKKQKSPLAEGYFLSKLNHVWQDLAGCEISKIAKPIAFKNHQLTLSLPSSSHMQDMHFIKEGLKEKINQQFPNEKVKNIYLQIRNQNKRIYFNFLNFKK